MHPARRFFQRSHRLLTLRSCLTVTVATGVWLQGMAPAGAARMATVVRGQGAGSDTAAALVGHYLRDAMGRDERYEVVDLSKVLGNQDRERALHIFQVAEELVQKGHEAYDRLDLDTAIEVLHNALQRYERQAAYVADFKKVAETLMLLGATHILKGEERLGKQCLEQAINVYPEVETDPRIFNPAMRAQFQQTANALSARPTATLTLNSSPGYAEVYVDGRFVGVTPLSLENVTEGRHYVRMERDAFRPWGKVLAVASRGETTETAALRATSHYEEFDALAENAERNVVPAGADTAKVRVAMDAADRLASLVEADTLLLAQVRLDGERVQVLANQYDLASHRLVRAAKHVFTYESVIATYEHEIAVMLHTAFGAETLAVQGVASATSERGHVAAPREGHKAASWHRGDDAQALPHAGESGTCWGGRSCRAVKYAVTGTTFGVGLASLAVATFEWASSSHTHSLWAKLAQVDTQQPVLRARGRNQALIGDILGGVGGALVIAGTIAFFVWEPGPSLEDVVDTPSKHRSPSDHSEQDGSEKRGAPSAAHSVPPQQSLRVGALPGEGGALLHATWTF